MSTTKVPGSVVSVDINIENKDDLNDRYGSRPAGSFRFDVALPYATVTSQDAINRVLNEARKRLDLMFFTNLANTAAILEPTIEPNPDNGPDFERVYEDEK